jgi:hypothetical protein
MGGGGGWLTKNKQTDFKILLGAILLLNGKLESLL